MTSCFVYKCMGLAFHYRINTQLIYRFDLAQVVARKEKKKIFRFESHWLLFFIQLFIFIFAGGGGGGSDFIILYMSYFLFIISRIFPNLQ